MGKVVVAQGRDLIKTTARINADGIEIDPRTKKPLKLVEKEYVPPPPHVLEAWKKEAEEKRKEEGEPVPLLNPKLATSQPSGAASLTDIIDALARKKVESITKLVDDRVVEILKESIQ